MGDILIGIIGIFAVVFIIIIIYLIFQRPLFRVQEQQAVIIERWGRFNRVVHSGLHLMIPGVETKRKFQDGDNERNYIDLRERSVDLTAQTVITSDNIQLTVDSIAYYQITDPQKAVYGVDNVVDAVNQLIKTVLRDVLGDTSLEALIKGRKGINEKLNDQVGKAIGDWGISIRSVELQSVTPPPYYVEAMTKRSAAEMEKQADIAKAEGKRQASILEAEGEAKKIDLIYKAIHEGNPNDELLKIKYLEALEKIADGQSTKVFMPFPANPTSGNFFQQAFGMAAGFDAYRAEAQPEKEEKPAQPEAMKSESQTTPITPQEKPKRKIIRRVVKKPPSGTSSPEKQ